MKAHGNNGLAPLVFVVRVWSLSPGHFQMDHKLLDMIAKPHVEVPEATNIFQAMILRYPNWKLMFYHPKGLNHTHTHNIHPPQEMSSK